MQQIKINLYSIRELSEDARQKAFEKYWDVNVDNDYWYDFTFDHFTSLCKTIGVHIPTNGIAFSGFCSQGSGSSFRCAIDIPGLTEGIEKQAWKKDLPQLELDLNPCPCDKRVIPLIKNGRIAVNMGSSVPNRGYWLDIYADYEFNASADRAFPLIETVLQKLGKWTEDCLDTLNRYLYQSLQEEYEYQTGEEAIQATFMDREYFFTADGLKADRLLNFVTE